MSSGREDAVERARKWLESMKSLPEREGTNEYLALTGLRFDRTEPGHFVCSLAVPKILVDNEGKWSRGAMATLIDAMSAVAIISCDLPIKISVDLAISYYSDVSMGEEVEIDSRVLKHKGKLSAVVVEIRKKGTLKPVALGRQWMSMPKQLGAQLRSGGSYAVMMRSRTCRWG
ncbi:unnamed protein product [Victoria cruziana]